MRDVEPDHRHVQAALEHALCRFRIGPDVELRGRRDVALRDRAAHHARCARGRRLHATRGSGATFVSGPVATSITGRLALLDALLHEADGVVRECRAARRRKGRPIEAALAVHVGGDGTLARERRGRSGGDGHVLAAGELENTKRVRRRLLERLVPVRRRDAEQLELGTRRARAGARSRRRAPDRSREHGRTGGTARSIVRRHGGSTGEGPRVRALPARRRVEDHPWGDDVV